MLRLHSLACLFILVGSAVATAQDLPVVDGVDRQPIVESTRRLIEALQYIGEPLSQEDVQTLEAAFADANSDVMKIVQRVLDPHCLAAVNINPESRVKVQEGPVSKTLMEHGWRSFLVKVHNEAGINPQLDADSPNAGAMVMRGRGARQRPLKDDDLVSAAEAEQRFLDLTMYNGQPLRPRLSGLALEYRIIQLYSRDAGKREASISFNVGQGTQDIGFRNSVPILFDAEPAVEVRLKLTDEKGLPTTAAFVVRDQWNRVYPNPSRRLAPDFFFHDQVYRADGEVIRLPYGKFTATVSRGPEYVPVKREFTISPDSPQILDIQLERWIHPASRGWYSGDHHVHAAGCAHYDSPTEGVGPEDMMRHILGEDLNVGCVLSWGPCWYTQKAFFEGKVSALSRPNYLMRYDVEVSGFPSSHAGHLCLLRLTEDDYPGTTVLEEWPSWTLPVLKWGQDQGGVVGYSHSGWGLGLPDYGPSGNRLTDISYGRRRDGQRGRAADKLPDYAMPPFDGIGANEYIVTVAHGVCDFISAVDTPAIWELNIWYHTLNC
ncbi:MAG: CehA/McbA family metallohydrolase, partial [Planctomycetaceae bacterium]|nr:CehA/McbA family metallohydrolase [Planctomycetaceae bacterium]